MKNSIKELGNEIHKNAIEHGWWEGEPRTFGDIIALCHSELTEALEEHRNGHKPTEIYYFCKYHDTRLGCPDKFDGCQYGENKGCNERKPEGVPIELADVIIRILDYCSREGIDIEQAILIKHEYNKTRPYRHGDKAY